MKASHGILASGLVFGLASALPSCSQKLRNIIYFDQYHTAILPPRDVTAGITHVVMSFANSSLFIGETAGKYTPFMDVSKVRGLFDNGTQVGVALGGWGDTAGFSAGAQTETTRKTFAQNVADMLDANGFDFVDIDWEYPGGNGADYKQIPNSEKVSEITTYPLLLQEIKTAIGDKPLSIAVPGREGDMIAYTAEQAPKIWAAVDWVNIMTYDLMNRRDTVTGHHSDIRGSLAAVDKYLSLGLPAAKANLGLALYAKYFETQPGVDCSKTPIGCPIVKAENDDGSDAGTSGAITFEKASVAPPATPTNLTASTNGACGVGTAFTCQGVADAGCCSQYGYCGSTPAHCGAACQRDYGTCTGPDISGSFVTAYFKGTTDEENGGQWYWDADNALFWTLDTVPLMQRKFSEIVAAKKLGGVMAWSLAEDSYDWSHLKAIGDGVKSLKKRR